MWEGVRPRSGVLTMSYIFVSLSSAINRLTIITGEGSRNLRFLEPSPVTMFSPMQIKD